MDDTRDIINTLEDSLLDLVSSTVDFLPKLLIALVLLIIGSIVASTISRIVRRGLAFLETNKSINSMLSSVNISMISISGLAGKVVKLVVMLVFWGVAVDVLGLPVLSDTFNSILAFVPKIFAASIVAGLTYVAAKAVYDIVASAAHKAGVAPYHTLGSAAKAVVFLFGVPLALAQLGFDLTIINNNITIIVAGLMLAFAIAFGLGGRDVAGKIVDDAYKSFKRGRPVGAKRKIQ